MMTVTGAILAANATGGVMFPPPTRKWRGMETQSAQGWVAAYKFVFHPSGV
jgi:hypothetical protein